MQQRKELWASDGDAFRQALRPGTVLETSDCAYLTVTAVVPEGVLVNTIVSRDRLYTWWDLDRWCCLIYSQPKDGELPPCTVPKLRERGGVVPEDETTKPSSDPGVALERSLARELGRELSVRGTTQGTIIAKARHANGSWTLDIRADGETIATTDALRSHFDALVAHFRGTGMPPMVGIALAFDGRERPWRYEATFTYDGEG